MQVWEAICDGGHSNTQLRKHLHGVGASELPTHYSEKGDNSDESKTAAEGNSIMHDLHQH